MNEAMTMNTPDITTQIPKLREEIARQLACFIEAEECGEGNDGVGAKSIKRISDMAMLLSKLIDVDRKYQETIGQGQEEEFDFEALRKELLERISKMSEPE